MQPLQLRVAVFAVEDHDHVGAGGQGFADPAIGSQSAVTLQHQRSARNLPHGRVAEFDVSEPTGRFTSRKPFDEGQAKTQREFIVIALEPSVVLRCHHTKIMPDQSVTRPEVPPTTLTLRPPIVRACAEKRGSSRVCRL
ncbi:hypothetical protein Acy02nite_74240 [Actinoplanes cyaneus]|uniref:Uncharacterized protein n=1 Tax=Actinoplanes cyaneus TaxID=52696 RepID=A0A919IQD2_9ACTN|nr:hypothetical protein Acy02nite_74240 [Actinoplanes cyaneus]